MDLGTPSEFWARLGAEHKVALDRDGYERVKRSHALRYFNWRWRPGQLAKSEQLRFLLRHSRPSDVLAAIRPPLGASGPEWSGMEWTSAERRAYVVAVRLLWRFAERHGDPAVLALEEPTLGTPLPVMLDSRLISQDLANSALETASMVRGLGGVRPERIIEVGGGYGRSAYALLHRFPDAHYTIVDIEPAASISRWYLGQLFPGRVDVIDPSAALELPRASFDLGFSISSLQEMRTDQVGEYLRMFDRVCAGGHVFLKQWEQWHNPDDEVTVRFDEYPIPGSWGQRFEARSLVQTRFIEAMWQVPS